MIQRILSSGLIALGLLLMTLKIASDREPGGIPVLLIAVGTVWLLVARSQSRRRRTP